MVLNILEIHTKYYMNGMNKLRKIIELYGQYKI